MYVLYHKKTRPTGRKIKSALGMMGAWRAPRPGEVIAVRWGNAQAGERTMIQQPDAIARAGNKLVSFQCFERDGVAHPNVVRTSMAIPADATYFGRKSHGMCGRDIKVFNGRPANFAMDFDFFSEYIPNKREYRIHVYKGEILGVMGKYLDFPDQAGDGYIKNYEHGYRFRTPDKALNTSRLDAAKAAVASLGLDFGAVDLIVGEDNKEYVLEVNTAPALFPLTFTKYIDAIKADLGS